MECPKCGSSIDENLTICPTCNKVIALKCPNCNSLSDTSTCQKCGYTILVKCSKCSKISPIEKVNCSKCGFSLVSSLALQECETDEFASIIIKFGSLKNIKKRLNSPELYSKFLFKLKNLLYAQTNSKECKIIAYNNTFVINLNKELSLGTSSNKAVRLALKIVNSYVDLNSKIMDEFGLNLNLTLTIIKKSAEELLVFKDYKCNLKFLTTSKKQKKYLKGLQIILDQYIWDNVQKDYKTDSLFTIEENDEQIMFYEIFLDSYVLPPEEILEEKHSNAKLNTIETPTNINENSSELYNNFSIDSKCSFYNSTAATIFEKLDLINFNSNGKIVSIKSEQDTNIKESSLIEYFKNQNLKVLRVNCSDKLNYKPWGFFTEIFKEYFNLPFHNSFINLSNIEQKNLQIYKSLFDLILENPIKCQTAEDARYAYFEHWSNFLSNLKNTVIIINNANYLDDTSFQALELYFDNYKKISPSFVFINNDCFALHSKIKKLIQTECYSEICLAKSSIDSCLSTLKSDATDFIQSFYYEKIKTQFKGSYLYFHNAIEFLKESGVLIDFENKLLVKNKKAIVIPNKFNDLLKTRLKNISQNQEISLILAYTAILGGRVDLKTLRKLGVTDVEKKAKKLQDLKFIELEDENISFYNYGELLPVIEASLKKDAKVFLAKNILMQISKGLDDTNIAYCMEILSANKEEYLTLWKNSQFAIKTGDYDTYLKNCFKFLSLLENINLNITEEEIEENKKDIYKNILMFLYSYAPEKIYDIENILLLDAIKNKDNENIVKLSNLMLQGALISANYTDALNLLHNILSRLPQPTLVVNGAINAKFLLLSLINVEILYNIGDYRHCVDIMNSILDVLQPEILEKVKPINFSLTSFLNHILETSRLAGFAKLHLMEYDFDEFFASVKKATGEELPDKDCIVAIKDFLAGKAYATGNIEEYSAYSKIIFLILQEFNKLKNDYRSFAQNIYQARLLAVEIHQKDLVLLCDLFIALAFFLNGDEKKAKKIIEDVLSISSQNAIFTVMLVSKYLMAKLLIKQAKAEEALVIINEGLKMINKYSNQAKILYALFEDLYIKIIETGTLIPCDIESEKLKISALKAPLLRILS